MVNRTVFLVVLSMAISRVAAAQTVEILYTPAVTSQALALKTVLRVDRVESFSALSLVGAPSDKKKAYADKVAGVSVLVVVGEDALKAAADVEFTCPVVLVGAGGRTAAKNRVIRVFSTTSPNAPSARPVSSPANAMVEVMKGGREVMLAGDTWPIVQALVASFK